MGSNYRPHPNRNTGGGPAPRILDRNFELKSQIHRKLIGVLNLDRVASAYEELAAAAGLLAGEIEQADRDSGLIHDAPVRRSA